MEILGNLTGPMSLFVGLIMFNTIGAVATMVQRLLTFKFKDNVKLDIGYLLFEASIIANGLITMQCYYNSYVNPLISDTCGSFVDISSGE